jgi:aspartyl protease family protein
MQKPPSNDHRHDDDHHNNDNHNVSAKKMGRGMMAFAWVIGLFVLM